MSEQSVKINCKEIEDVQNNILTEQNFDEMNTKYKNNPILELFRVENRCPGFWELSLIGKWLKTLQGIPGLDRVEKYLVEAKEKYWHARLQLKIAASIERNDNSEVVSLEPKIKSKYLKDYKRHKKPDILANIKGNEFYIEVATSRKGTERIQKYQEINLIISEMAKSLNLDVTANIYNPRYIPGKQEREDMLKYVGSKFMKGILPFTNSKERKNVTINVKKGNSPNACSLAELKYENGKLKPYGVPRNFSSNIDETLRKKSAQIPTNLPGLIVIEGIGGLDSIEGSYIKDGIQKQLKKSNYCSNIIGLAFISNHMCVDTGEYIEEANFEIVENPYCTYNHGINTKDIVDGLTGRWHVDSTCFERYRSLFENFYGRVFEHVLKQRYNHWQEKARREADSILFELLEQTFRDGALTMNLQETHILMNLSMVE